jgi:WD40 repeat protein
MRTLSGHTKDVRAVAFASDGRLISGGNDKKVLVWDPLAGKVLDTIKGKNLIYAVAVSATNKTLAFAGKPAALTADANSIRLWDLDKGQACGEYRWPRSEVWLGSIWSLSFSADGDYLAAASRIPGGGGIMDGAEARWWRSSDPAGAGVFPDHAVFAVAFGPAEKNVAVTRSGEVALLDSPGGRELQTWSLQSTWASAVVFLPSGNALVIAASSFLQFVNVQDGKPRRVKTGFRAITSLAVSPDGNLLLVGGRPEALEFYDTATRTLKASLDFGLGAVHSVAFSPDGFTFAVGGAGGLMVCDVP